MSKGRIRIPLQRLSSSGIEIQKETIVEEHAVQLTAIDIHGDVYTHTTLLATPIELLELHAGHVLSEGYVRDIPQFDSFEYRFQGSHTVHFNEVLMQKPRGGIVTSSCGACNHQDLMVDTIQNRKNKRISPEFTLHEIQVFLEDLTKQMTMFKESGGSHGSAFGNQDGSVTFVAEDIGRHNAVDKTIGKAMAFGVEDFSEVVLLLSGRCGWDIVAKAVRTGISAVASYGAFSSAAVTLARENEITLYGFVSSTGAWKVGY